MKLAVLALIGSSSAVQYNKWQRYQMAQRRDIYSNELANGDTSDDKQLEDIDNAKYDIADDVGFNNLWKHVGNVAQRKRISFM